ncbi:ankyrin repeat domain-containing protein 1-like [Branchiostoma lanceolatum]|uniref:ankyrin repeat domain-containing protein 1-like n=1 Tax=Branchiostoma lanceolatum TaxID=7740 RepID=UPI003451FB0F
MFGFQEYQAQHGTSADRGRKEPRVFIIHAGEDKGSFVRPLVGTLQQQGLPEKDIFFDDVSLKPGDAIRDRIISTLSSESLELAVIVVSTSFLNKSYWPRLEFETCLRNNKPVFPIWVDANKDNFKAFSEAVGKYSPTLKQMSARRVQRDDIKNELRSIAAEIMQRLSTTRRHVTRPAAPPKVDAGTFHQAVLFGDVQTVRRGLEGGLQDGFQLKDFKHLIHQTPLHLASMSGHAEVAELLIQHGDNLEAKDLAGQCTPLHIAAMYDHTWTCEVLIRSGANIMSRNSDLNTPLHEAAERGNTGICELLIRSGADVMARNKDGKNAFDVARGGETRQFMRKSAGVKPNNCNQS